MESVDVWPYVVSAPRPPKWFTIIFCDDNGAWTSDVSADDGIEAAGDRMWSRGSQWDNAWSQ